jgi:hypothetical protein
MPSTESHFSEAEQPMEDMGLDLDGWLVGLPGGLFESDTISSVRLEVHVSQTRTPQLQEIGQNGEVTSQEKSCGLQSLACLQYRRLILHITIRLLATKAENARRLPAFCQTVLSSKYSVTEIGRAEAVLIEKLTGVVFSGILSEDRQV